MLAERRNKAKYSTDPNGNLWAKDSDKFGQKMLERMGWSEGSGLGKNGDGITAPIKVGSFSVY